MTFPYSEGNKRYHSWNYALRNEFGGKIFKVPIDGGFDCPNRDGTVAHGGCTFCSVSGSGDMIVAPEDPLPIQFQKEIDMMHQKWPHVQHNIRVCTHLINGLPGESLEMMKENVRRTILDSDIQGIKLHLMHLMRKTRMLRDYHEGRLQLMSRPDYVNVICDQLEMIPKEIIIHRLTGDAPWDSLIGPMWSLKKWEVLNAIDEELLRRDSFQGKYDVRKKVSV